jgi:hypothetical protein
MISNAQRTKIFVSYAHADRRFLDRLHVFLEVLEGERLVDWWDDTRLKPGVDWREEIKEAMDTAKVAVLLVSADFQASRFIREHELPPLLEAAKKDRAVVLQVFLGPINLNTWDVSRFQAINDPERPLGKLRTRADRDEVWVEVSKAILAALESSPIAAIPADRIAIEKTAETIALIERQSPASPPLQSAENRKPLTPSSSSRASPPNDADHILVKDPTASTRQIPSPIPLVETKFPGPSKAVPPPQALSPIQRAWWRSIEVWDEFKSCRLSLIALIGAYFFFIYVGQGTEVLRAVAEGTAGGQWYWPRVFGFFAALILWAICNWYTARALFYFDFPGVRRRLPSTASWDNVIDTFQTVLPRLLGVAPFLLIGFAFLAAARSYDPSAPTMFWLHFFAAFCAVLATALYGLFVLRRRLVGKMPTRELQSFRELDRGRLFEVSVIGGVIFLVSLLLFLTFTLRPVAAQNLGPGTIVFFALSSWVTIGSVLVFLGSRWQFPTIGFAILLALLFSYWNDNHFVRILPAQEVNRSDVISSFRNWYALAEKNDGTGKLHPLFVVVSEGGGIRAAYWTATVLGGIQDANPNFASHLFAISAVSGGSLGAGVFEALLAEPNPGSFKNKAHDILGQDFLSPALASTFYPDLLQRFLPFPIPYFDRGRALELGWEKAWRDTMRSHRFADSFVDLWKPGSREWMPALFLNGTSVEKGNRIITSNLRLTNVFLDAEDAANKLQRRKLGATQAACHIPLSTAIQMSYRLPPLSPAGRLPDGSQIVDGSFFEDSAATTALEIVTRIKDICAYERIANVDVKVIMISNDPREASMSIAPANPGLEPPGPKRTKPMTTSSQFLSEITAPLYTLLNTRDARGVYAQKAIKREQRRFKIGVNSAPSETEEAQPATKDIIYFGLRDTNVPLPLGWMLSAAAAKTMQDQLQLDDDVVQNGAAMEEVLKILPPATR